MKIGELTLNEIKKICDETKYCNKCRLYDGSCPLDMPSKLTSEDLEREVESGERNSTV